MVQPKPSAVKSLSMSATFVLIGGGEIGQGETYLIDQRVVALSSKPDAKLLFLPTAAHDAPGYFPVVQAMYSQFGCDCQDLNIYEETPDTNYLQNMIDYADIIYIGGGNTRDLLRRLKDCELDRILLKAAQTRDDLVIAGFSAGASMWFDASYADCDITDGVSDKMVFLKCLGYLPGLFNPHAQNEDRKNFEKDFRKSSFKEALSLDSGASLILQNGKSEVWGIDENRRAVKLWKKNGKITHQIL